MKLQRRATLAVVVMVAALVLAIVPFALRRASATSETPEEAKVVKIPLGAKKAHVTAVELPENPETCPPSLEHILEQSGIDGHRCIVMLPPLASVPPEILLDRVEKILEGEDTSFPFTGEAGYNISLSDARSVDDSMRSHTAPGERMPMCAPSTYDGHGASDLAKLFLPGAPGELKPGDELVDLGAGIGKVLAVVALATNTSASGIELSAQRFETGCAVLKQLQREIVVTQPHIAIDCPVSRRIELWHGDFLEPPHGFLEGSASIVSRGSRTYFAYANCFPYGLLGKLMRRVSQDEYPCVRFLSTKVPVSIHQVIEGLRRAKGAGGHMYTLYTRDGDQCRL